jgi:hypothetical protein
MWGIELPLPKQEPISREIKGLRESAREIFRKYPEVKQEFWVHYRLQATEEYSDEEEPERLVVHAETSRDPFEFQRLERSITFTRKRSTNLTLCFFPFKFSCFFQLRIVF